MANPFDIANFNLVNFAQILPDLLDSDPKTVEYIFKDLNGNLQTKNIENRGLFKKHIWDDVGSALGQFSRTFYVDAVNGDDNNDGSSTRPFKTFTKAYNSIPYSGFGEIIFTSDYVFEHSLFTLKTRTIKIYSTHKLEIEVANDGNYNYLATRFFISANSAISIALYGGGQLIVGRNGNFDSSLGWYGNGRGVFVYSNETPAYTIGRGQINILVREASDTPIVLEKGILVCPNGGSSDFSGSGFDFSLVTWKGVNNVVLHSSNPIGYVIATHPPSNIFWYTNLVDENGNSLDITSKISGVIKDTNGVPRNIVSNIVF